MHTETKQVTYYSGHVIEIGGRRYVPERTCRDLGGEDGTVFEHYDFGCSECGFASCAVDARFCPECGARVTVE